MAIIQHLTGQAPREPAVARQITLQESMLDMAEVRGQERAKRALEIAAAGRHHVFLVGPPGSGKSMMAARMASILPPQRDGGVRDIHDPIRCGIVGVRRHSIHTPLSRTTSHRVHGGNCRRGQTRKTRGNFTGA